MLMMLLVFLLVVGVDRAAKSMVAARLQEGAFLPVGVLGVRLTHVVNRRRPWASTTGMRVMAVAWLVISVAALRVANLADGISTPLALGALTGGALGNLIDGISRNGVTDFIDLRVWPVFNVADAAITGGALVLLWNVMKTGVGA